MGVLPVSVVRGQIAPWSAGAQNPANGVINRRLSWAGRRLLPRAGTASAAPKHRLSYRGAGALPSYSPPSTLSLLPAIYHPLTVLTTPPRTSASVAHRLQQGHGPFDVLHHRIAGRVKGEGSGGLRRQADYHGVPVQIVRLDILQAHSDVLEIGVCQLILQQPGMRWRRHLQTGYPMAYLQQVAGRAGTAEPRHVGDEDRPVPAVGHTGVMPRFPLTQSGLAGLIFWTCHAVSG